MDDVEDATLPQGEVVSIVVVNVVVVVVVVIDDGRC